MLDIILKDGEVYDAADALRERGACIVFYSAYTAADVPEAHGDIPLIEKPASAGVLCAKVLELCAV